MSTKDLLIDAVETAQLQYKVLIHPDVAQDLVNDIAWRHRRGVSIRDATNELIGRVGRDAVQRRAHRTVIRYLLILRAVPHTLGRL